MPLWSGLPCRFLCGVIQMDDFLVQAHDIFFILLRFIVPEDQLTNFAFLLTEYIVTSVFVLMVCFFIFLSAYQLVRACVSWIYRQGGN